MKPETFDIIRVLADWRRCEMDSQCLQCFNPLIVHHANQILPELRANLRGKNGEIFSSVLDQIESITSALQDIVCTRTSKIVRMAQFDAGSDRVLPNPDLEMNEDEMCLYQCIRGSIEAHMAKMGTVDYE